jgi:hypothetical protein
MLQNSKVISCIESLGSQIKEHTKRLILLEAL